MMGRVFSNLLILSFWIQTAFAQSESLRLPRSVAVELTAVELHASILLQLTNPGGTQFRVGVALMNDGVLVSSKDSPPIVEHVASSGGSFHLDVMHEMNRSDSDELVFPVKRRMVTAQNCPLLGEAVSTFYSVLELILAAEPALDGVSPVSESEAVSSGLRLLDSFLQVQESMSTQIIRVEIPLGPSLHDPVPRSEPSPLQAIVSLVSTARICAREIESME